MNVKNFGMWKWKNDYVVVPRESSWFFSWDENRQPIPLKELQMYEEDWIGLRSMYENGQLFFYTGKGDHMHLEQKMMNKYLAPLLLEQTPKPSEY